MKLTDFDYVYPEELVAQRPPERRDDAKMMYLDPRQGSFKHSSIKNLPDFLAAGDLLVVNNSKVFPARLFGNRESGGQIEILLLSEIDPEKKIWSALATRKKRIKSGDTIVFNSNFSARVLEKNDHSLTIKFDDVPDVYSALEKSGFPPLPPYIKREHREDYTEEDRQRYQTIYAKNTGSAAAPTAGFHLTEDILKRCREKGVETAEVTLHVGIDTFMPVRVDSIKDHRMHGERYFISEDNVKKIEAAKKEGRRVVAVGTTTVRALESAANSSPELQLGRKGETDLFITPGYKFKIVDAILTNFHQPKSTLLMMVSAFAGREFILKMYAEAIKNRYRLFSYGDCMLIAGNNSEYR